MWLMNIYKFNCKCYKCGCNVEYYTYLIYHIYENDVTFPIDMSYVRKVYAEMPIHKESPYFDEESYELNFPIKVLGDDEDYDNMVMNSGKFPNIKVIRSRMASKAYAANLCPFCKSPFGNYHLRENVTDMFLKTGVNMDIAQII